MRNYEKKVIMFSSKDSLLFFLVCRSGLLLWYMIHIFIFSVFIPALNPFFGRMNRLLVSTITAKTRSKHLHQFQYMQFIWTNKKKSPQIFILSICTHKNTDSRIIRTKMKKSSCNLHIYNCMRSTVATTHSSFNINYLLRIKNANFL